jgi:hypothetical protein
VHRAQAVRRLPDICRSCLSASADEFLCQAPHPFRLTYRRRRLPRYAHRSATPDNIQVSHPSGGNESLCRRSHFGYGERQCSLQANAYSRPTAAGRGVRGSMAGNRVVRSPKLASHIWIVHGAGRPLSPPLLARLPGAVTTRLAIIQCGKCFANAQAGNSGRAQFQGKSGRWVPFGCGAPVRPTSMEASFAGCRHSVSTRRKANDGSRASHQCARKPVTAFIERPNA